MLTKEAVIHLKNLLDGWTQVDVIFTNCNNLQERNLTALKDDVIQMFDCSHFQVINFTNNQTCCTVPSLLPLFAREPIFALTTVMIFHYFHDFRIPNFL